MKNEQARVGDWVVAKEGYPCRGCSLPCDRVMRDVQLRYWRVPHAIRRTGHDMPVKAAVWKCGLFEGEYRVVRRAKGGKK